MRDFAALLDRLTFEPSRNSKLRLMADYFRHTPDPERGWALAALTDSLSFRQAKPALIRTLVLERVDPVLFGLSYDYVGDLSETVALIWPARPAEGATPTNHPPLLLSEVVEALATGGRINLPPVLARWLDALDETGRWALLKLVTGSLRVGVSARLAKTALAQLGGDSVDVDAIEQVWHGLEPPYGALFAWVEGRGPRPSTTNPAPFRPPMLAHALEETDLAKLDPAGFRAEWKWDGIRLQVAAGRDADGTPVLRLYSRTGEEATDAFPDLAEALSRIETKDFAIDGELLVVRDGAVQPFSVLQQRLNRKTVTAKHLADFPAHLRAYDVLALNGEDLRGLSFDRRRARLEDFVAEARCSRLDASPLVPFGSWEELARLRLDPSLAGADAAAVEGLMLKRRDSPYVAGRPTGPWWKWKRDPFNIDAVLMYAQRGSGKRSSFYSDFTFGVWKGEGEAAELVPVGKSYFGFTDAELAKLDRYVRHHTRERFGPVRVVEHGRDKGLVLEIAFEGINRSARHKSGVAMRFPRVARIRWDKPPAEADRMETLEMLLRTTEPDAA